MSEQLKPLSIPLHGSRLIEASAGTGKTWTIAALYLRLILGHGRENGFARALMPSEILVMTFTRAATRELSDRIRQRLLEAAQVFAGDASVNPDPYLLDLLASYPAENERRLIANTLRLAAESMDEAAVFTIDGWCQRMLREHAFDSGSLFDEELVVGEQAMINNAMHDYWRQHVYPMTDDVLDEVRKIWRNLPKLQEEIKDLLKYAAILSPAANGTLAGCIQRQKASQNARLTKIKAGWMERAQRMEDWIIAEWEKQPKCFSGVKLKKPNVTKWFAALRDWAMTEDIVFPWPPDGKVWTRLTMSGMAEACNKGFSPLVPDDFAEIEKLAVALAEIEPLRNIAMHHAATSIARRISELKLAAHQFGFEDLLSRLKLALEGRNGAALKARIVAQFPVAMIDEFQDTSPDQYRIFDLLYEVDQNSRDTGLFLIGDPKQAIYRFRGADIHSYLRARRSTAGRHYQLMTNFRSTVDVVSAVNRLFLHADGYDQHPGFSKGAFHFKTAEENPLPFEPVSASGRAEHFVYGGKPAPALTVWCDAGEIRNKDIYQTRFAERCAEHIATSLNDPERGFISTSGWTALRPADIAILVRNRIEAKVVRRALRRRGVASVYLSDNESVFKGSLAVDMSRWLVAIANPEDTRLARAAIASATFALPIQRLLLLASDDIEWEVWIEQLKTLRSVWQRQGVLAMMRRLIHDMDLPAKLLQSDDGERNLTDLLHLSELLQAASQRLEGMHALIRWFDEQIEGDGDGSNDDRTVRLESDSELVKVVTVHKSKGLEYPLVYLPFAASHREVSRKNRSFSEFTTPEGNNVIDFDQASESIVAMTREQLEEDLRLMYVAVTRARHAVWMGAASIGNKLHLSALGYLLGGGAEIANDRLVQRVNDMAAGCAAIHVEALEAETPLTRLTRKAALPTLIDSPEYTAKFDRHWSIASYTSITRGMTSGIMPSTAAQEKLLDQDDGIDAEIRSVTVANQDQPWHSFPRGSLPGQFLHEQLEWLATEGFASVADVSFDARVAARCDRAGWGHRKAETATWIRAVATTPLKLLSAPLSEIKHVMPEMEFWFPANAMQTQDLDLICRTHLLDDVERPPLIERQLQGMLKGYADLVFEHEGRYWVLDYKSNSLGSQDASYHVNALVGGMASHRYEVQGLIYLLALHRLLRARLGDAYDPVQHLGGAIFYFLRGVGNSETGGCYHLIPSLELLDAADAVFNVKAGEPA
jgi:exodeoxyribonuclease V beta subunit